MEKLVISLACHGYDRARPLIDGRVPIEGCSAMFFPLSPEESFYRAFLNGEFDVSELSMSSYVLATARGDCPYIAIPVFLSRVFRHSAIYIRTDRGINAPHDLRGKLIGVPEYQMTAAVWAKGILSDEYGVRADQIVWRSGGLEEPGRIEKLPLSLPGGFDVRPIPPDRTLNSMLSEGELDAVVSGRAPSCLHPGNPNIARLFPDFRKAEKEYFRKTRLFPIMHTVGVRRDLVKKYPWLPVSLFKAFSQAKKLAMAPLSEIGVAEVTVPWIAAEVLETKELMGEDYWPYGVEPNRKVLETMIRYSVEQGLLPAPIAADDLFAPGTLSHFKV